MATTISNPQARRFILAHQGLWPPYALKGGTGILTLLGRLGCIQFDPLDIVGKNPELVLQARIGNFRRGDLTKLLYSDRKLVDGWDKMMSIYPVGDWPAFFRARERYRKHYSDPSKPANTVVPEVRAAIEERGPLSSIDLEFDQRIDWHWAPTRIARAALESMYFWGELIVHHKVHTRKVYDLARRHIPMELLDAPDPHGEESDYLDWHVLRRIGGVGMLWGRSGDVWLGIHGLRAPTLKKSIERLTKWGKAVEVSVEGSDRPFYIRSADLPLLDDIRGGAYHTGRAPAKAAIIAPLDNLLWDRKMVKALFGFDYVWEVYKPASERRFGYYVLPVLYGERFIARFEPGRDKETGEIEIRNWWWEPEVRITERMRSSLRSCFGRLIRMLNAPGLTTSPEVSQREGIGWLTGP